MKEMILLVSNLSSAWVAYRNARSELQQVLFGKSFNTLYIMENCECYALFT